MGSQYPPGFYDDEKLAAVESAFRDIWKAFAMEGRASNEGLRVAVIHTLLKLVDEGTTRPDQLRATVLMEFGPQLLE
jgi:hypothetical protein